MTWREVLGRLRAWRRRDVLDRELADDMLAHVQAIAEEFARQGMSRDEALSAARRQVGNLTAIREQSRAYWGFPWIENLRRDVRYAARGLRRSPGFTVTAVLTLGLGIGANAAMFGVIDRLMFRPFPLLRDQGTVHRVYLQTTIDGRTNSNSTFPYTRYKDLQRESRQFSEFAALSEWRMGVGTVGEDVVVRQVAGVSASLFAFFDAPPVLGRYFTAAEDSLPGGALVAVLSHEVWRTAFSAGDVIGRALKIGSLTYTIIGVAPRGFAGAFSGKTPELFVPITTIPANLGPWNVQTYYTNYQWDWTDVLIRRKPGVSVAAASADLTHAYIRSRSAARLINPRVMADSLVHPAAIAGAARIAAGPGAGLESKVLLWVLGVAGIVLLIACASVANLMLARVMRRRREITVRLALGVSRQRLAFQVTVESLMVAVLGCATGILVAQWGGSAIRGLLLPEGSRFSLIDDWRTLSVALFCALTCTLLTTLAPVFAATRTDLAAALKSGARDGGFRRSPTQVALLVTQVSLSVILLVGAALFVQSVRNARAVPLGYDARPVLEVRADFRGIVSGDSATVVAAARLIAAARALPGVRSASFVNSGLFATNTAELRVQGIDSVASLGRFNLQIASPDFFDVMQTRILRGRGLLDSDRRGTPRVAVVSDAMGRALWPGKDPIGQCFRVGLGSGANVDAAPCTTVVGVSENTTQQRLGDDARFMYYLPVDQIVPGALSTVLLRMEGAEAGSQVERIRRALTREMPGDGFVVVRPLQEVVDNQIRSWRLGATMFVAFGALALVVAIVGLYGMISYNVAGRMHELGVRAALGAEPARLIRLVVGNSVSLTCIGVAIGLVLALGASRWVEPLLFRHSATDLATYIGVGTSMLVVSVIASLVPAVRASRADPSMALRAE
ncbi:MAG: ABC transporter permease [Gemmatimonadaceae bacterium]|nr:ABC transporter permease [Gemmatimonadaceae bacterium]